MAQTAVAQEAVRALRREIARIEGRPDAWTLRADSPALEQPPETTILRRGEPARDAPVATGAPGLDAALAGGLPRNGLLEITTAETRDAAACAGFALGLAALDGKNGTAAPLLWIGTLDGLRETGTPYLPGLHALLGPGVRLLLARPARIAEALWVAEEALNTAGIGTVLVEAHGPQPKLDLTATRRLHRRAQDNRRRLLLLRQGAAPEPTAAPLRFTVAPAPARSRNVFGRPLSGTIGPPAFAVTLSKSRAAARPTFVLDWNSDEHRFAERRPQDSRAVVSASRDGPHLAGAPGSVLAFGPAAAAACRGAQGEEPIRAFEPRRAG